MNKYTFKYKFILGFFYLYTVENLLCVHNLIKPNKIYTPKNQVVFACIPWCPTFSIKILEYVINYINIGIFNNKNIFLFKILNYLNIVNFIKMQ